MRSPFTGSIWEHQSLKDSAIEAGRLGYRPTLMAFTAGLFRQLFTTASGVTAGRIIGTTGMLGISGAIVSGTAGGIRLSTFDRGS